LEIQANYFTFIHEIADQNAGASPCVDYKRKYIKLNQNTAGIGSGKLKPFTSYSFVSKVTSMLDHHPKLSKKNVQVESIHQCWYQQL
jgi:hypothetical protein